MKPVKFWALLCTLAAALTFAAPSWAQAYPNKSVRVIVPYSPGSNPDLMARMMSKNLADRLGQPFVIDTKIGAGGSIGTHAVAKSAAPSKRVLATVTVPSSSPGISGFQPAEVPREPVITANSNLGTASLGIKPSARVPN